MQSLADVEIKYTTIRATIPVVQEIKDMCRKSDSYNDFLIMMLNFVKKHQREFMKDNKKNVSSVQAKLTQASKVVFNNDKEERI